MSHTNKNMIPVFSAEDGVDVIPVINRSSVEKGMANVAFASGVETVPVTARPHECEGGAAVCGHRSFDFVNPENPLDVVYTSSLDDYVGEKDQ